MQTEDADYACRLFVDRAIWVGVAAALAEEIDYDNFKSAVKEHQGPNGSEYVHRLHDVWSAMYKLQKR